MPSSTKDLSSYRERVLTPTQRLLGANGTPARQSRSDPKLTSGAVGQVPHNGRLGAVDLATIPVLANCHPGFSPTEYNVLVAPPAKAEMTAGKVYLADETKDADQMAAQVGRLVAVSPIAFNYDDAWPEESQPKVGDLVWFARYSGSTITGLDGADYRIVKDRDVGGVIEA